MTTPPLDRVLIVSPHPDDEVIASGGLIARAIAGGGMVRVLLLTGGESNPWPQRAMYRRWTITPSQREAWRRLRVRESTEGLLRVGASPEATDFLGFPDQALMSLARRDDRSVVAAIEKAAGAFGPSLIVTPSSFDYHSDHRAAAWITHEAARGRYPVATYCVHGTAPPSRLLFELRLTPAEQARKREAIGCHASQTLLSRRRFLAHAADSEAFYAPEYDLVHPDSRLEAALAKLRHVTTVVFG